MPIPDFRFYDTNPAKGTNMIRYIPRTAECEYFPCPAGMPQLLHRLLMQRGVRTAWQAEEFLHPSADQLNDPILLSCMAEAVSALKNAVERGRKICVYGDYDVDGVSASAIMISCLRSMGGDADVYLPSRHSEGYGLNEDAVREIAQTHDLLITVDCGIASHDLIDLAKSLGLECIVTDHHRAGDVLPDCPTVNPQLNDYPFPYLCGAGVAWKISCALVGIDAAMQWIDLAAVATVADVVSLTGENRAIVHLGLKKLNKQPRIGLRALMERARLEPGGVTAQNIAFRIAPRLNAGGRLGDAKRSYDLLVCDDALEAYALADLLEQENARRQKVQTEIRDAALKQLADFDFSAHRIVIVHGEGWNSGVIGLAASHLREALYYPVIAMAEQDGVLTGSCRSIPGVDIYRVLSSASDLMVKFGGHAQAAGLTVLKENLSALQARLDEYLFANVPEDAYIPTKEYDLDAELDDLSEAAVRALQALQPTGTDNPDPVFRSQAKVIEARPVGAQGAHLKLTVSGGGTRRSGIFFGAGALRDDLQQDVDMLYTPELNVWNGVTDVQLSLSSIKNSDLSTQIYEARASEGEFQRRFLTQLSYNKKINHDRAPVIDMDQLARLAAGNPRGMLILCMDLDAAQDVLNALAPAPDLYIGRMCADGRMFNAVCVCPDEIKFPPALRTLVLAGVPEADCFFDLPMVQVLRLNVPDGVLAKLPDVDQMREVYKAALHLFRRPLYVKSLGALDIRIGEETGLDPFCCRAALLALRDMDLVQITESPFTLRVPPAKKTDPNSSAVWRLLQAMKPN